MLKGIDPLLNADVLQALRAMGHGDDLMVADTNFPADSVARQTVFGELLRIDNVTAGRAAKAILSVMPLDAFVSLVITFNGALEKDTLTGDVDFGGFGAAQWSAKRK